MSDPQPPEGVLHEYRPSCARSNCSEWPMPGRPFCAAHERELEGAVKPGLSEDQWVGGVDPAVAKARADALERQYAQAEEDALVAEAVKAGAVEELARVRIRAEQEATRYAGPDPDTAFATKAREVRLRSGLPPERQTDLLPQPDYVPADPDSSTAELLRYLRGEHGEIKRACAMAMINGILEGLRAL